MTVFIPCITYIIEYLIALNFFNDMFLRKGKSVCSCFIGALLYGIAFAIYISFGNTVTNTVAFFIVTFVFAVLCFRSSTAKAALSSLFLTAVMNATEFLTMCILSFATDGDINAYSSSTAAFTVGVVFSKTLYLIVVRLTVTLGFNFSKRRKAKNPIFLIMFPVCSLIILYTFYKISSMYKLCKEIDIIISLASVAIMTAITLTYIFYGKTSKELDELYSAQAEAERISTDTTYYALLDRQNNLLKAFIHDEKNHLSAIKSLADNPAVDEYIDRVYGHIKHYSMFGNTKNKMLDLIINKYQYICENEGISFSVSILTANLSFMEQADLITLLSNILDNAVEAAKKSTDRIIDLSINRTNNFDVLTCVNSCLDKPATSGRALKSSKKDKGFHGLGIKSIKRITGKYNGDFEWTYNDDSKEFTVYIVFNPKK